MSNKTDLITSLSKTSSLCALGVKTLRTPTSRSTNPSISLPPLSVLRNDYISLLSLIHNRALSLSLALKPPLSEAAVHKVLDDLNADLGRFTNCALAIDDETHGEEMRKQMRWGAEEVLEGVQRTAESALEAIKSGLVEKEGDKRDLIPVASLLSTIERLKETLPKDNKAAIVRRWGSDTAALEDGVREIRDMIEEGDEKTKSGPSGDVDDDDEDDDEGDNGWGDLGDEFEDEALSGQDLERAKKVFPLLRLVALLHKRLLSHHLKVQHTPALEESHVVALFKNSTALVSSADELASSLYTPQEVSVVLSRVKELDECVRKFKLAWDEWETEQDFSSLKIEETGESKTPEGNNKDEQQEKNAANRKWFDMCFVQIDRVVKDLEGTLGGAS